MNNTQRTLLVVYLPLTVLLLVFDNLYPRADMVQQLKYTVIITLLLAVFSVPKRYREQKIMSWAYLFIVIADFFFVFSTTLHWRQNLAIFGIASFFIAYLILIAAWWRNFRFSRVELFCALPIVLIFLGIYIFLFPHVQGAMVVLMTIFGIVLCAMTWTAQCTVFRGYFSRKAAWIIALAGSLIFISDLGVALSLFHPGYFQGTAPWLKNLVWGTYVPAWTLLAVVINEEKLLRTSE